MASRRLVNLFGNVRYALNLHPILLARYFSSLSRFQIYSLDRLTANCDQLNVSKSRNYAKGKDKRKSSEKKIEIREDMLQDHINVRKFRMELEEAVSLMKEQFIKNLSLRSSSGAIEAMQIDFEGEKYTIRDLAQINRKNPKLLALNFSAFPQTIPVVLQALQDSGMNLNPQQDGSSIYLPIPKVTREHRENLAKNANVFFNKCKLSIKNILSKYLKKLEAKQDEGLSTELYFTLRDQVTFMANEFISQAEKMKTDKTKELLGDG